jgi:D-alanyl-D-alanine carboxypeptidase
LLRDIHKELGIPEDYGTAPARAWQAMMRAASNDGISLLLVSGFRGITYQAELFRKKLAAGQKIDEILCVNAAPGYSQHHTGRAIDIATPDSRPLTLEFEVAPAFAWLTGNASRFGFSMPYGRDNPWGIDYEPWHWFFSKDDQR